MNFDELNKRIKHLEESCKEENWSSYGSLAIDPLNNKRVINFLCIFQKLCDTTPSLVPTNSGGILIVWSTKEEELEIEINPGEEISGFYENRKTQNQWGFIIKTDHLEITDKT